MSDETTITERIRSRLEQDPRLPHADEVAVSERHGTVTLRGSVGSLQQKRAAVQDAKSVRGVRDVEDELHFDLLDHQADDRLRGVALQALISDEAVPAERVEVTVADGWLTLKGEVEHQCESNAAFEAVRGLPGIGGITNRIVVITAGIDG